MALSGAHIACGYVGGVGATPLGSPSIIVQSLLGQVVWSQTMISAGTTSNGAPSSSVISNQTGQPSFEIYASVDVYVAIGGTPDAVNGPRIFVPANTTRNIFCQPGDKLAWIAA